MAAAFRSAATVGGIATTNTVTAPTGMAAGDYLIAAINMRTSSTQTWTATGWTAVTGGETTGSSTRVKLWHRFAVAADVTAGSFAFSWTTSISHMIVCAAFTGVDPAFVSGFPSAAFAFGAAGTTTAAIPSVTGILDGLLVEGAGASGGRTFSAWANSAVEQWDANNGATSTDAATGGATVAIAANGATASGTVTLSASSNNLGWALAISPSVASTNPRHLVVPRIAVARGAFY